MAVTNIAVAIPVGPREAHAQWLVECVESVIDQTVKPSLVVLVDDMHGFECGHLFLAKGLLVAAGIEPCLSRPPWRLGVAMAFNTGCAVAFGWDAEICVMLGSDDRLEPRALEQLAATYEREHKRDGYYWFEVQYDSGEQQSLPCNGAAMTAGFMRATGGLPVEASLGGMDAALISAMLVHDPDSLIRVGPGGDGARYWVRQHPDQEGAALNRFGAAIVSVRNTFTETFQRPDWGRYA
jgi:glycosyltransferase involved in cell wall biosynthesis